VPSSTGPSTPFKQELSAALQLLRAGRTDEALAAAEQLASAAVGIAEPLQLLGICHAQLGNDHDAEQAFQRALRLSPGHPQILANLATLRRRQKRQPEAVTLWNQAVKAAPEFAQAWLDLGLTELDMGRMPQALLALQKAVRLMPQLALAWLGFGNAQRGNGDLKAAETAFAKAVALDPGYGAAWLNLGNVQRLLGRPEKSLQAFDNARRAGLEGPVLADANVGALLDTGQADLALQQARRLVHDYPDYAPGHVSLAHLQWELAADDDPLGVFRAAALEQPQHQALQLEYIGFLLKAKRAQSALEHIERNMAHDDHPLLLRLKADAYEQAGRRDRAGELYDRLYRGPYGQDTGLLNAYTRHLLKSGQWDHATRIAEQATQLDMRNQEAWAYLATGWRLLGDPREFWLCDYQRHVALLDIEPPAGYSDLNGFLAALRVSLEALHTAKREPVQQSLRGGSQTGGNLFGRTDPVIQAARKSLQQTVERWLATLPEDATHPFLQHNTRAIRYSGSWSVKLWSSGKHINHIHPEGWLSSAFYVSLPSTMLAAAEGETSGHIQFGQPLEELELNLTARRSIRPEPGKLALFPSYMWHGTVPFIDSQPRITAAFDMLPKQL
jgi:tetratricopeptide (TPR) repeat protein